MGSTLAGLFSFPKFHRTHLKSTFGRDIGQSFVAHETRTKAYPRYSESEATQRHKRLAISREGCG